MVAPGKQRGSVQLLDQHRERLPPIAKRDREKNHPRDVSVVFEVLIYPTLVSIVLVVEYSDHEGRHMKSPAPFPLGPRD